MSSATFVDRIDPFAKRSLKKKKKSQGSSRYRNSADVELQTLPLLKGIITVYYVLYFILALISNCVGTPRLSEPFGNFDLGHGTSLRIGRLYSFLMLKTFSFCQLHNI
ncbi:hypothetical protein AAG570_008352 [Ranatra chinensis]|uniref:Uncharacterized protein n=1 Tax=Ranatra chinensis TaxID=642074 RepID=A0ABD0XVJ7_9HEMI